MKRDAFSQCHPAVNFAFFLGAIGFGVTIQHPAYAAAGVVGAAVYYLLLNGLKGFKMVGGMLLVLGAIAGINPLLNTSGKYVLQYIFGRPYTLEALCYGAALGALFVLMMLWFGCYSAVLTSDKFTALFGNLIPSLSMLLVMVLRMIPAFTRKAKQILAARQSIGKGADQSDRLLHKAASGTAALSALTDWALEGSIITADSMRARGYGTGKRTTFQIYRMTLQDWILLTLILTMEASVLLAGGTTATFTPRMRFAPLTWGFWVYCVFLLIPTILHIREAIQWRICVSKI